MPGIKKAWKKASVRKYGKRRGVRRGASTTLANTSRVNPVAQRYICKMKYSDTFQLTAAGGSVYRFNLNSIFDPNRSGVGHQPYGRDQFATLYNRYRVFKATYTLTFFNSTNAVKVAVCPANIEMGAGTVSEIIENPQSKWGVQMPGGAQKIVKGVVNLAALTGRTSAQYMADDRYQALMTESPLEALILNVFGQTIGDTAITIDCAINITYHVELFDRNSIAQS